MSTSMHATHSLFHSNGEIHTVCDTIHGKYDGVMAIYCDDGSYAGYHIYKNGERVDGRTHTYFNDDCSVEVSIKKFTTVEVMVDGA